MSAPVRVRVPGDKSISHRALIFASLAEGESVLRNVLTGNDVQSTADVLRRLGCDIPVLPSDGAAMRVRGTGPAAWRPDGARLDCGNSGTTARLMLGALAGGNGAATLTGDASLRSRPMRRVTEPLERAGAQFEELGEPDRLPVRITGGTLRPIQHESRVASAQVKSALLLAALRAAVPARIVEPLLSRDHTERMLSSMGVRVRTATLADGRIEVVQDPGGAIAPLDLTVPGDFSSAAFLLAVGLAGTRPVRIIDVCLNPTRTGLLAVLERMGGRIEVEPAGEAAGEPIGTVTAWPSRLHGTTVTPREVPALIDEVPVLAVLGARAEGVTRIEGAAELRVKESDRLAVLAANLGQLGVDLREWPEGIEVRGSERRLRGRAAAHGDHRMAMAFGVLGAVSGGEVRVDTPDVAAVSFPEFWRLLEEVRGKA